MRYFAWRAMMMAARAYGAPGHGSFGGEEGLFSRSIIVRANAMTGEGTWMERLPRYWTTPQPAFRRPWTYSVFASWLARTRMGRLRPQCLGFDAATRLAPSRTPRVAVSASSLTH